MKWYGKYGRKLSWNVKWYGKYRRKVSWIVKRYGNYGRKLWKDREVIEEREPELWTMDNKVTGEDYMKETEKQNLNLM